MLYDLLKTTYGLPLNDRLVLLDNFDNIVEGHKEKKTIPVKRKIIPRKQKHIPETENRVPEDLTYIEEKRDEDAAGTLPLGSSEKPYREGMLSVEAKVFDPETPGQMLKVMDLLDKFMSIDEDISGDNVAIFLHPLSNGSKKHYLRQYRLIGMMNELWKLTRQYDKLKRQQQTHETDGLCVHFCGLFKDLLMRIREKLESI